MKETRFHRAAREGYLDQIKEANRKDCNTPDEDGMTPTLWAAARGNLDALRLLTGRGGDPDKCDFTGNSALHWAAQNGHINCAYFLVNFGVNIWAQDNFRLTARDVAAMKRHEEILRLLDAEDAKQTLMNKKRAESLKDKARKEADKRIKQAEKKMQKEEKEAEKKLKQRQKKLESGIEDADVGVASSIARPSISIPNEELRRDSRLIYPTTFSEMVNPKVSSPLSRMPISGVAQRIYKKKEPTQHANNTNDFKITERDDDGNHTVRSINGIRKGSDVLYVPKFTDQGVVDPSAGHKKTIGEIYFGDGQQTKNPSLSDYIDDGNIKQLNIESHHIFERPGFGKVAFRQNSLTGSAMLSIPQNFGNHNGYSDEEDYSAHGNARENRSKYDKHNGVTDSALETFLKAYDLEPCLPYLKKEHIDFNTLSLLSENDLKDIGIPMGHRKKMLEAIDRRKMAIREAEEVRDSRL